LGRGVRSIGKGVRSIGKGGEKHWEVGEKHWEGVGASFAQFGFIDYIKLFIDHEGRKNNINNYVG